MCYAFFLISYFSLQHHWRPQLLPVSGLVSRLVHEITVPQTHRHYSHMNADFMWLHANISLQNISLLFPHSSRLRVTMKGWKRLYSLMKMTGRFFIFIYFHDFYCILKSNFTKQKEKTLVQYCLNIFGTHCDWHWPSTLNVNELKCWYFSYNFS